MFIYLLISFVIVLFIFNYLTLVEGLDNNDTDNTPYQTIVYKNQGAIQNLQEKYPQKNIKVITISQDTPRSLAKVKSFAKSHRYNFTYLLDLNGDVSSKLLLTQSLLQCWWIQPVK